MQTIRRFYLYAVSLVSFEVVMWGAINLVRTIVNPNQVGGTTSQLAGALAFILVGIPVFLLHWWLAQRGAAQEPEERFSGVRALFMYVILAALLVPVVQNLLAILNRGLLLAFGANVNQAWVGYDQNWGDNIVAILANLVACAYFYRTLQADWQARPRGTAYPVLRRVYRYAWVLYGLGMTVAGLVEVMRFLFVSLAGRATFYSQGSFAGGLSLVLVGTPLFLLSWRVVQKSLVDIQEQSSLLRLVVLYVLVFSGVAGVLIPAGNLVREILSALFSSSFNLAGLMAENAVVLGSALAFGGVWAYFGRVRAFEVDAIPDSPRRSALRRVYAYLLAFFGLLAAFFGLELILATLIYPPDVNPLAEDFSTGLAALVVGLPLWLLAWLPQNKEALADDEAANHARRSVVRRTYLYLVMFLGVVGVMFSAGSIFYMLLMKILGETQPWVEIGQMVKTLVLVSVLLAYHWFALRKDNAQAAALLLEKHRQFPVLIVENGDGAFAAPLLEAMRNETPEIPVVVHRLEQGIPPDEVSGAAAVVMPAIAAASPSEVFRIWLQSFKGHKVVVPLAAPGWVWIEGQGRVLSDMAAQLPRVLRQLAEGEPLRPASRVPGWVTALAIVGGGVLLFFAIGLVASIFG